MFKMKPKDKLRVAQSNAIQAVAVFRDTMKNLNNSNQMLREVIDEETKQINEHQSNIQTAEVAMIANQTIIEQLKVFVPN